VERIRDLKMLPVRFEARPGFNAEEYLKHSWGIIQGELVTVKVIFSKSVARYIRDRLWHPSQMCHSLLDGRLEMTLQVADTLEVRRWVLGYGPDAEVLEPVSLRDTLRQQAEALAAKLIPTRIGLAQAHRGPRLHRFERRRSLR
jgi:predicted DNA-binding transcriptional regulator YafY